MPGRFHVGGKVVDHVDLLRKRHWPWRLDVWPFAIIYAAWIVAVVPSLDFGDAVIVLGGLVALHILAFLFTVWSVDFGCFVKYSKVFHVGVLTVLLYFRTKNAAVNDIHQADACKVTPAKFCGSKEVVPLHFRKVMISVRSLDANFQTHLASLSQQEEEVYFDFRKQCFIYSKVRETFCKLPYPSKEAFGYYLKSSGHGSEAKVIAATEKWGRNAWVCLPFTVHSN
ncbi:hypothetical protein RHGRI_004001 [Rhododendron griersonianum]|uniref:P5A-ATPase transmembrane helical hairpin domain-containing protein n=1 Tax=Rhododendron griersonianum TaxID=479676 RepID=A0AAV6L6Y7_9ERIC|nr:hypothetical protein RHGRI_004001 [Rhododendron griersonianum]